MDSELLIRQDSGHQGNATAPDLFGIEIDITTDFRDSLIEKVDFSVEHDIEVEYSEDLFFQDQDLLSIGRVFLNFDETDRIDVMYFTGHIETSLSNDHALPEVELFPPV